MKYRSFEELPVWQSSLNLALETYELSVTGVLAGHAGLRDQLERATLSSSNNIAEGFERGTHEELLTFLYIARGSAGEVRSMLILLSRLPGMGDVSPSLPALRSRVLSVSRQLGAWMESLKNSGQPGP